jgi:hypothetical protein
MERRMTQPSHFSRGQESARMVEAVRAAMRELAAKRVLEHVAPMTGDMNPPADRRPSRAAMKRDRNAPRSTSPASRQRTPTTGAV